jgi:hypothetical protein
VRPGNLKNREEVRQGSLKNFEEVRPDNNLTWNQI